MEDNRFPDQEGRDKIVDELMKEEIGGKRKVKGARSNAEYTDSYAMEKNAERYKTKDVVLALHRIERLLQKLLDYEERKETGDRSLF